MTEASPVRCPKCGKPPPLRRASGEGGLSDVRISYECNGCGIRYVIDAGELAEVDGESEKKAS